MTRPASGFRMFVIVWCGQLVSLVGSSLTAFALGVHVYKTTGSVSILGFVFGLAILPAILASPIAGPLVDRWGAKRALIVANAGNVLVTLSLFLQLITHTLTVWHVYLVVAALSAFTALENPAFASVTPQLVPQQYLGNANGLRMFAVAASELLAPVTAGFLLLAIGLSGIVVADVVSFGPALLTLVVVRIPPPRAEDEQAAPARRSLLAEVQDGWRYVAARPGLFMLLLFLGAVSFSAGFIDLLLTPLVLDFASPAALGTVVSIGGLGMIAASAAVSAWGGPRRRVRGMLGFSIVLAASTIVGSSRPDVAVVAFAAFAFMGALGVVIATNQTIWQTKVEPHLRGRVTALVNMVSSVPQVVAYAVAGVLANRVFEPLVGRDQVRSPAMAVVVGHGPDRGVALLMMVMGILIAVSVSLAASSRPLRRLEADLPDVAPPPDNAVAQPDAAPA
jgi:MFS transporter, DHA3 family, macrolide efflux protein